MEPLPKGIMGFLSVLISLVWISASTAAICPPAWRRYGDSCYLVIERTMKWQRARDTCAASGGRLALPNSAAEQAFIFDLMIPQTCRDGAWIDCNDMAQEGKWLNCPLRDDGTNAYQNWGPGQPDDIHSADCALMNGWWGGQWDDQGCSYPRCAVCEMPVTERSPEFCTQTGADGRVASRCLSGHVIIKELPAIGIVSCGKACRLEPRCSSFNLLESGRGKTVCQLNNVAEVRNIEATENCYSFDL